MFRARERGMSFWPFAVSLLLVIVLLVMWFSATTERDQAKANAAKAEANRLDAVAQQEAATKKLLEASKRTGFLEGGNVVSPEALDRMLKEYGPKLRDAMTMKFPADRYQEAGEGKIEKTANGEVTVVYLTDAELADITTLEGFLSKFEVASTRMSHDITRAFNAAADAIKEKEAAVATADNTIKDKDKRIGEVTAEKTAVENQKTEQEKELKDQIAQKDAKIAQVEADLETQRKQATENEAKLIAQSNELTGQVRTLVQREAPVVNEGPDGEVIVSDNGIAIVNRGKSQFLMPGTVFDVLGRAKGGATYKKGSIKVTSVDNETARAAILEENARDPITRGDLVQSLVYSPNRTIHFVLIGDFKKMGKSTAEALLRKQGAVVDAKVTSETNYLVVGMPAAGQNLEDTEAYKSAKDLGIRLITEEELGSFVRY